MDFSDRTGQYLSLAFAEHLWHPRRPGRSGYVIYLISTVTIGFVKRRRKTNSINFTSWNGSSWISRIVLGDIWARLLLSIFDTPEDRDGLIIRAATQILFIYPRTQYSSAKKKVFYYAIPNIVEYLRPPRRPSFWKTILTNLPRGFKESLRGALIWCHSLHQFAYAKPASFSNYFTKVLLILFPKINSNLRPSRRLSTQILPTVGTIIPSIKIADY